MATPSEIAQQLDGAKCIFNCYDAPIQAEMQTYILALAAGVDPDPIQLAKDAACINCLNNELLIRVRAYLFNELSSGPEDPQVLAEEIKCYQCYVPHGMLQSIDTWNFLNDPASPSTDPAVVANLARCFSCQSPVTLLQIQVYLLCQIIYQGECDLNSILFQAQQNPVINADPPVVTTDRIVVIRGGGGLRGCTDREADQIPVIAGNYVGGVLTSVTVSVQQICCQPDELALFQCDDTAGGGAVGYATKNIPGGARGQPYTYVFPITVAPTKLFFVASQICKDTESPVSNAIPYVQDQPEALDWADRVEANGGARPGQLSITVASQIIIGLSDAGISGKIKALNFFAPDNLIAAITPLIVGNGNDPWTNNGPFVLADLTTRGLKGNGSSKWLNIGLNPSTEFSTASNGGMTVFSPDSGNELTSTNGAVCGLINTSNSQNDFGMFLRSSASDNLVIAVGGITGSLNYVNSRYIGGQFFSGSRTAAALLTAYSGGYFQDFFTYETNVGAPSNAALNNSNLACHAAYNTFTAAAVRWTNVNIGFCAIHDGLDATESEDLFDIVLAARLALGDGGTNEVDEWADRVELNGGAAPSSVSVNAMKTFVSALKSASVWDKLSSINVFCPDSLTACITPLKVGPGRDPWTNNNFVAGDVTTTGILGANTKYLYTSLNANNGALNPGTSGSLTVYLPDANTIASLSGLVPFGEYRASDSTRNCLFQPKATIAADTSLGAIGGYQGGLNRHVQVGFPGNGYFCVSRTAANLISLYWANSGNPHALVDTGADASLGSLTKQFMNAVAAFEYDAAGPNRYYLAHVSFAAVGQGLTLADSAALYAAVQALRTSFGGGYV